MKANTTNFILTLILAIVFSTFLPWWSVMLATLATGFFIPLKKFAIFFIPFLSILLFWSIYSFILSNSNDYILAQRIAVLLPLGGNPYFLVLLTGIVGGLASGMAGIFGNQLYKVFKK
ncbi:MAG: hypothetical protein NWP87_07650 [Winogradskyella sp.]|nr:hypothetical protein [Winogradskyella sp.]